MITAFLSTHICAKMTKCFELLNNTNKLYGKDHQHYYDLQSIFEGVLNLCGVSMFNVWSVKEQDNQVGYTKYWKYHNTQCF